MLVNRDFKDLLRCLNDEKAEYVVVGAYAVIFHTEPRYTKDIDVWVRADVGNAEKVLRALKKFGAPVTNLSIEDLANEKMVYQIGVEPNRIDIIMGIEGLSFDSSWKNRVKTLYDDEKMFILDLHDVIRAKKLAGRPQDLLDLKKLKRALQRKK